MPGIDWSCPAPKYPSYVNNVLLNNSLTQVNKVYSNKNNHILDLLFTNNEDKISLYNIMFHCIYKSGTKKGNS